jgi:hypothetical protein
MCFGCLKWLASAVKGQKNILTLTDLFRWLSEASVFGVVKNVGVSAGSHFTRWECSIIGAPFMIDYDQERYRDHDKQGRCKRQQHQKAGCVTWECESRNECVEKGTQSKRCQRTCCCGSAMRGPVQGR